MRASPLYDVSSAIFPELLLKTALGSVDDVFDLPNAAELSEHFRNATPFPNVVVENFFKPRIFAALQNELVAGESNFHTVFTDVLQTNKTISTGDSVPPLISLIAAKFASARMLRYLEEVTGLSRLVPDPYYNTDYGYYHIVGAGGVLGSHVDHSHHSTLRIPHVLNIVVYLTSDWRPSDGGALCLFDGDGKKIVKRIECQPNRAAIFACTPNAYHGVEPVSRASGRRRHSLYFAYYSVASGSASTSESFPASTNAASNLDPSVNYGTYFVVPWRQLLRPRNWNHLRTRLIYASNLLLPPIIVRGAKRLIRAIR